MVTDRYPTFVPLAFGHDVSNLRLFIRDVPNLYLSAENSWAVLMYIKEAGVGYIVVQ